MIKFKIGIDEAGRWPWLGPVVACAFAFHPDNFPQKKFIKELNDSKKLTENKRQKLFTQLIDMSVWEKPKVLFWVWVVDNFIIDEINIRQANREAMRRALVEILRKAAPPFFSLNWGGKWGTNRGSFIEVEIDGSDNYTFEELKKQPKFIVWWDGKIPEIGAASIIAKVFRDDLMKSYSRLYPELWVESHKWYGTKKHREYLKSSSCVTGIHRVSYKPVEKVLEN